MWTFLLSLWALIQESTLSYILCVHIGESQYLKISLHFCSHFILRKSTRTTTCYSGLFLFSDLCIFYFTVLSLIFTIYVSGWKIQLFNSLRVDWQLNCVKGKHVLILIKLANKNQFFVCASARTLVSVLILVCVRCVLWIYVLGLPSKYIKACSVLFVTCLEL